VELKRCAWRVLTLWVTVSMLVTLNGGVAYTGLDGAAPPNILYVKPAGAGGCTSWADACTLQSALAAASAGAEIWVAAGTHLPAAADRTATFQLKSGVAVYGGFAGIEAARVERDWVANVTILSGDLQGNDSTNVDPAEPTRAENSYHVVTGSGTDATAVLDGFTIEGGNANGASGSLFMGGGMYSNAASPTLANVIFTANTAQFGGGMCSDGSPALINVIFSGNSANRTGGGLGGGMFSQGTMTSPTLTNVLFNGNTASKGGGMVNYANPNPVLVNVTFSANGAWQGGGLYSLSGAPALTNAILWGNTADDAGPQIYNDASTPTISYSLIQDCGGSGPGWDSNLGTDGGHNIAADPQFIAADGPDHVAGTLDDNLRLPRGSAAVDAGDKDALPLDALDLDGDGQTSEKLPVDLDGSWRVVMGLVDMGAYEAALKTYVPLVMKQY
jgi:hypothetical protein